MPAKRVFLWSAPRSISTAFEFSIATLENAKVFHEVFCSPYYSDKGINPYKVPLPKRTFMDSKNLLLTSYPGKDVVFSKEMALYISGRFDMLLDTDMKDFVHTFLIRDPKKTVPSGYQSYGYLSQDKLYLEEEVGFRELRDLYYFVKANIDPSPLVIDADDLLENPEDMMKAYCQQVGIEFKDGMTKWEAGSMRTQHFIDQKGGAENLSGNKAALQSSGISKSVPCAAERDQESFPEKVVKCIKECTPLYQDLYQFRLVLNTQEYEK